MYRGRGGGRGVTGGGSRTRRCGRARSGGRSVVVAGRYRDQDRHLPAGGGPWGGRHVGSLRGFGLSSQAVVGGHSCGETLTSRERGVPSGRWRGLVRPARRRSAARSTRSQGGGLRFPLFVHTTVGEKPDEYDWWEDHVPTRCTWRYLAAVGASRARAVGLAR